MGKTKVAPSRHKEGFTVDDVFDDDEGLDTKEKKQRGQVRKAAADAKSKAKSKGKHDKVAAKGGVKAAAKSKYKFPPAPDMAKLVEPNGLWVCQACMCRTNELSRHNCRVCGKKKPTITGYESAWHLVRRAAKGKDSSVALLALKAAVRDSAKAVRRFAIRSRYKAEQARVVALASEKQFKLAAADFERKAAARSAQLEASAKGFVEHNPCIQAAGAAKEKAGAKAATLRTDLGASLKDSLSAENYARLAKVGGAVGEGCGAASRAGKSILPKRRNEYDDYSDSDDEGRVGGLGAISSDSDQEADMQDMLEMEAARHAVEQKTRRAAARAALREHPEEEVWQRRKQLLRDQLAAFDLAAVCDECGVGRWTEEFRYRGFDDVCAFAAIAEHELKDMFLRPHLRRAVLKRASALAASQAADADMEATPLMDRVNERHKGAGFTFDGVHFYDTVEHLTDAWEHRPPDQDKGAGPTYIAPPAHIAPRGHYQLTEKHFPFADAERATTSHAGEMYHSVFGRLFDTQKAGPGNERANRRPRMLLDAVAARDDAAILIEIETTDPEELALEATKRSFDPALAAAAFSRQPDMVRMLMAHASARGLKSALLVAGTQRGEGCVPVLKVLLGKELACAPGAALGEVAVAAAQRGALPSLKLLLGARGDDTKGPPPRLVQKALMAAAAKRYYGAVKMLLPKVDDAAKERLAIFAGFVADQGGGDALLLLAEAGQGDSDDPREWSKERVWQWGAEAGLAADVLNKIKEHGVDGAALLELKEITLQMNWNIRRVGPRRKLVHAIEQLHHQVPPDPPSEDEDAAAEAAAEVAAAAAEAAAEGGEDAAHTSEEDPLKFIEEALKKQEEEDLVDQIAEWEEDEEAQKDDDPNSAANAGIREARRRLRTLQGLDSDGEGGGGSDNDSDDEWVDPALLAAKAEAVENARLSRTTNEDTDFFAVGLCLEIIESMYEGWFEGKTFVDCTARSPKVAFAAALAKSFLRVVGVVGDAFVYEDAMLALEHHKKHTSYHSVLPRQRYTEQVVEFVAGDFRAHHRQWKDATVLHFNCLNDDDLAGHVGAKETIEQLRELEAGTFMVLLSTAPFDRLLGGEGELSAPGKRYPNRFDQGRIASYVLPGWDMVQRWRETPETSRGAMDGFVQLYRKVLEKGEFSDAELLEMLEAS